eukprot:g13176.t1 g13176   contig8:85323-85925(-)
MMRTRPCSSKRRTGRSLQSSTFFNATNARTTATATLLLLIITIASYPRRHATFVASFAFSSLNRSLLVDKKPMTIKSAVSSTQTRLHFGFSTSSLQSSSIHSFHDSISSSSSTLYARNNHNSNNQNGEPSYNPSSSNHYIDSSQSQSANASSTTSCATMAQEGEGGQQSTIVLNDSDKHWGRSFYRRQFQLMSRLSFRLL